MSNRFTFRVCARPAGRLWWWACLALLCAWTRQAQAGGLYISDRGARALGRGGALVAGAEGLEGIGYNPAAIAGAGNSMLLEMGLVAPRVQYTREQVVTDPEGTVHTVTTPPVNGDPQWIPLPTIAASLALGDRWVLAGGLYAPHFALLEYADQVQGQPSPARYMLGSITDSRLALPGLWLGFAAHPTLQLGVSLQALAGIYRSRINFSLSLPDRVLTAPEAPDYDALAAVELGPFVAPTASAGLIWTPHPMVKLGLSGQLPTWINASARVAVRLPSAATFDTASVEGSKVNVRMRLPAVLRGGLELTPVDAFAVELAYVHEMWSLHDRIVLTPEDMVVRGIIGGPEEVDMPPIEVPRNYRDSRSFRLGARYTLPVWAGRVRLRAGLSHERSAVAPAYLSLGSLDFDKIGFHGGLGVSLDSGWDVNLAVAHTLTQHIAVAPSEARLTRINPFSGNAPPESINGGRYRLGVTVVALSFKGQFGRGGREVVTR